MPQDQSEFRLNAYKGQTYKKGTYIFEIKALDDEKVFQLI